MMNIMKNHYKHKSNKKFIAVEFNEFQFFETYENVGVHVKSDDKKYKIYEIGGFGFYDENIDDCYKKQNEIDKELAKFFKNAERVEKPEIKGYRDDADGVIKQIAYYFKSRDYAVINCVNYKKWSETLEMSLITKKLNNRIIINYY